jgi:hypothetical protein
MIVMAKRTFELPLDDRSLIVSLDHGLLNAEPASHMLTAKKVQRLMGGQVVWIVA